ncbi:MAG TPA: glycosyltransferase 87 family protein, partial [Chloroflexota bacterium]
AGMLVALSTNRRSVAGVLLAVCLLLKPIAWPVLLLLVLRRDWKTAGSCLLGGGVVALVTTAVVGPLRFVDYFLHSLPLATDYYRLDAFNISLMSLATRLFVGAEYPPGPTATLHFLPLVYSPLAGTVLQGVVAVSVLAAGLLATRHMPLQPALVCMLIVSLLITPTAWDHYLVLTLLPVAFLIAALRRRGWPRHLTRASAVLLALIALPAPLWEQVLNIRLIQPTVQATGSYWPIASAALALMPAYILIALAALGIFVEWGAAGVPSPTISEKRALLVPQRAVPGVSWPPRLTAFPRTCLRSEAGGFRVLAIVLAAGASLGLIWLARLISFQLSPGLSLPAFNQDYLLAEAIRHGIDPNMRLPAMGALLLSLSEHISRFATCCRSS